MKITVDGMEITLLVGSDPEVFASVNDKLVSAFGMVKGTKEVPFKVKKGAIQVDGMALEFNIEPADSVDTFVSNIKTVMSELKLRVPKGVELSIVSTAEFGADYIKKQPDEAKELGCSPDFNAYTGKANEKPNAEVPFRTAAGHVHIGWTQGASGDEHVALCCELTKVLDLYLGVPSLLVDKDTKRRELYGAAGAFREKLYGLEYRVLSNFWLKSDENMRWVYNQTANAIKAFMGGFRIGDEAQQVINNSDIKGAKRLINQYNLEVPCH